MTLSAEQTRPIRLFETVNLISAAALMAGAMALGKSALLPGALAGAVAAAVNVRLTRIVVERFLQSESKDHSAALALFAIKVIVVLACIVALVYPRPDLAPGMALGFTSIVPASLVLAVNYALRRLD
ncbi:MAG: hypothetical protein OSB21_06270 [Myxococcota bacterium]|jgi:hypothetical protein|nr:hypothetical protein [Myxococcota bacterium]